MDISMGVRKASSRQALYKKYYYNWMIGENIFLKICENFSEKLPGNIWRFLQIIRYFLNILRLLAEYVCNFIHTFGQNRIFSLENTNFFI